MRKKQVGVARAEQLEMKSATVVAIEATQAAGKVLMRHFGGKLRISEKGKDGLVTNADFAAQNAAVKILKKAYPRFNFLTEEAQPVVTESPGRWILDPLDGTTNFIHGYPMFCVSLGLEWAGEIVLGVIYHPVLNDIYLAKRGKGASLNGKKIYVSQTKKLKDALLTTGFAYAQGETLQKDVSMFQQMVQKSRAIRRPGSAALDLAYTACGVFDGFWERHLSPWDVAAGSLLVTEAGGKVTDFAGKPFRVDQRQIVAANGELHAQLVHCMS